MYNLMKYGQVVSELLFYRHIFLQIKNYYLQNYKITLFTIFPISDVPANPPREKSLAEELIEATSRQKSPMLQDAETDDNDDEVFLSPSQTASKLNNESREHLFDRLLYFNVSAKNAKAYIHCDNPYIIEDSFPADKSGSRPSSGATVKNCRTTSDSEGKYIKYFVYNSEKSH